MCRVHAHCECNMTAQMTAQVIIPPPSVPPFCQRNKMGERRGGPLFKAQMMPLPSSTAKRNTQIRHHDCRTNSAARSRRMEEAMCAVCTQIAKATRQLERERQQSSRPRPFRHSVKETKWENVEGGRYLKRR